MALCPSTNAFTHAQLKDIKEVPYMNNLHQCVIYIEICRTRFPEKCLRVAMDDTSTLIKI